MDIFSGIQLLSLLMVYSLLISRVKMLNDRGIKAFVLGKGKFGLNQVIEIVLFSPFRIL